MTRRIYVFWIVLSLGTFSCQKKFSEGLLPDASSYVIEDPTLVESVKQYYSEELEEQILSGFGEKYVTKMQRRSDNNPSISEISPSARVSWQKARTVAFRQKKQIVEVPLRLSHRIVSLIKIPRDSLSYTPDRSMLKTIFDRLLITKEKGKEGFVSKVIRYHPDKDYLIKYNYKTDHLYLYGLGDYTGYLEYITPDGNRTAVVRVVHGKPIKRYRLGAK